MRNPFELDYDSVDGDSEPPTDFEGREEHVHQHQEQQQQRHLNLNFRPKQEDDGDRALLQEEEATDRMKRRFIGTIDQGTTSTRFIIFDCTGVPIAKYQTEFRQIHEHPGYVTQSLPFSSQTPRANPVFPSTDGTNKTHMNWWSPSISVLKRP